ncbi:MAG: helix-turn-helix domain-containing protein [Synergistaceae bacterium]|jgi:ParB-like chromosome segregation protein Spo0J|nr:helix-turn-helix domain-containing protein [Synergistaceae bacterium]
MQTYQFLQPLQLDEYEALRESIRKYGVIQPVITDEDGKIVDGYHRAKVCKELGIDYPTRVMEGLSEEEKENLSISLNLKRRHLTKEQKKELAINLREQGWTQERIAGVMEVSQSTLSRWLMHLHNPDQPSPNDPSELDRLKKEIADREAFEKKQEQEAERLRKELEAAKNAPAPKPIVIEKVVEKPVASPEFGERLRQTETELEAAKEINQKVIEKLVAARTAEMMAEIEEKKQALDKQDLESQKRHNEIDRAMHERREVLEKQAEETIREIQRGMKVDKDVSELEKERTRLAEALEALRSDIEHEQENAKMRTKLGTLQKMSIYQMPQLLFLIKEKISKSDDFCGLVLEELEDLKSSLVSVSSLAYETLLLVEENIERAQKRGGLKIVK